MPVNNMFKYTRPNGTKLTVHTDERVAEAAAAAAAHSKTPSGKMAGGTDIEVKGDQSYHNSPRIAATVLTAGIYPVLVGLFAPGLNYHTTRTETGPMKTALPEKSTSDLEGLRTLLQVGGDHGLKKLWNAGSGGTDGMAEDQWLTVFTELGMGTDLSDAGLGEEKKKAFVAGLLAQHFYNHMLSQSFSLIKDESKGVFGDWNSIESTSVAKYGQTLEERRALQPGKYSLRSNTTQQEYKFKTDGLKAITRPSTTFFMLIGNKERIFADQVDMAFLMSGRQEANGDPRTYTINPANMEAAMYMMARFTAHNKILEGLGLPRIKIEMKVGNSLSLDTALKKAEAMGLVDKFAGEIRQKATNRVVALNGATGAPHPDSIAERKLVEGEACLRAGLKAQQEYVEQQLGDKKADKPDAAEPDPQLTAQLELVSGALDDLKMPNPNGGDPVPMSRIDNSRVILRPYDSVSASGGDPVKAANDAREQAAKDYQSAAAIEQKAHQQLDVSKAALAKANGLPADTENKAETVRKAEEDVVRATEAHAAAALRTAKALLSYHQNPGYNEDGTKRGVNTAELDKATKGVDVKHTALVKAVTALDQLDVDDGAEALSLLSSDDDEHLEFREEEHDAAPARGRAEDEQEEPPVTVQAGANEDDELDENEGEPLFVPTPQTSSSNIPLLPPVPLTEYQIALAEFEQAKQQAKDHSKSGDYLNAEKEWLKAVKLTKRVNSLATDYSQKIPSHELQRLVSLSTGSNILQFSTSSSIFTLVPNPNRPRGSSTLRSLSSIPNTASATQLFSLDSADAMAQPREMERRSRSSSSRRPQRSALQSSTAAEGGDELSRVAQSGLRNTTKPGGQQS